MPRFAVGIDLGTTNCALAFVNLFAGAAAAPAVETFAVPQLVEVGEVGQQPLLPSFAYLPGMHELAPGSTALPWDAAANKLVGAAARKQGGRVPGRLVVSAKSWLCHPGVDRRAAILPWNADEDVQRISPVAASALYLKHLRDAWNATKAADDEENRLERQRLVLTVPASFDEAARELTVAAAQEAGLEKFTLLEEPQAAFYDWLHGAVQGEPLPVGSVCVIIDCGGGTTDFSLIGVAEQGGQAEFERLAVGDHLLLGGDNMDLAVARHFEHVVTPGRRLDPAQWGNLVLACRQAKEGALSPDGPEKTTITVRGRGAKVIGQTLRCDLDRSLIRSLTLDGFLPAVGVDEEPSRVQRGGLQEFGLPYVADPAITRHLAAFLRQHAGAIRKASLAGTAETDQPTAVLFNGGVFNAAACRERVLEVMRNWFGADWRPRVLSIDSLDLAVARGAAYAAWAKETGARRIRGGAARSYYVGIGAAAPVGKQTVLCVVPHGLAEGEQVRLDEPSLELQIGEPASFPLFTSTVRTEDKAGQVLTVEVGQLGELPALTTILRGGKRAGAKMIPVRLETMLTEIGTLDLFCAAQDGNNRWRLQLQARPQTPIRGAEAPSAASTVSESWSLTELEGADSAIRTAFSAGADPRLLGQLNKTMETALAMSRSNWPTAVLRALWEPLREVADRRAVSGEFEARWLNLVGYCLRPGWGDPLDAFRVEQLWKSTVNGPLAARSVQAWSELWVLYRRVAGGLDVNRQKELAKRLLPIVLPGSKKSAKPAVAQDLAECWRAVASLERLPAPTKVQLGRELFRQAGRSAPPTYALWALARLGARLPLYGPLNETVGREEAQIWVRNLLELPLESLPEVCFAVAQIARTSGDRARDVDDELRDEVVDRLRLAAAPDRLRQAVADFTELERGEEGKLLGDVVPPGLRLAAGG